MVRLVEVAKKCLSIIKREGLYRFVKKGCERLIYLFFEYHKSLVFELNLAHTGFDYHPKVEVRFKLATLEDIEKLNNRAYDFTPEVYSQARKWLLGGDFCLVGYLDGKIVTYAWVNSKERELPGHLKLRLGAKKIYLFKTFTIPEKRGLGLNPACLAEVLTRFKRQNYLTSYIDVRATNLPSLRAIKKVGFKEIGRFRTIRIFKWKKTFFPKNLSKWIES